MTADAFVAGRRAGWQELESRMAQAHRGRLRGVSPGDLERFGVLYRRASSDLAIARRDFPDDAVTEYLNDLCARAHPLLFRGSPLRPSALPQFFATGLPRIFRAAAPYVLASLGFTLVGFLAGWLAVSLRPDIASTLIPNSYFDKMARGEVPPGLPDAPFDASYIITNNIRVALIAFAGGVLLGIPTAAALLLNGWTLGTIAAAIHRDGLDLRFWSIIAPHGIIELSVIVFAGAAGLMLGDAILRPGLRRRTDALAAAAGRAVYLAVGMALLLVIAGLFEAFVSPQDLPEGAKYAIAAANGTWLYSWLLLSGRTARRRSSLSLDRVAPVH